MKPDGTTKDDLKLPAEDGEAFRAAFDEGKEILATVLAALGIEQIKTWKTT
jgi:translation initiation factor 5A